jgi:Phospholipase_D-nuclease N-terminal
VLYGYGFVAVVELCLLVYCALNIITTPESEVRNLPKLLWLVLVLFFPLVGGVAWLVAGRPQGPPRSLPYKGNSGALPGPPRSAPSRASALSPDDDEDFLRRLRDRAEEQRRRARDQGSDT